jgi:hypothetical protein
MSAVLQTGVICNSESGVFVTAREGCQEQISAAILGEYHQNSSEHI